MAGQPFTPNENVSKMPVMGEEGTTRAGAFEKYAKAFASIAVGIGALVSLLSASSLIDAKQKELDYEKSLFELSAVPCATSQLEVTAIRTNEICELSGSVAVKNAGRYPILIDSVLVKVWQLPPTPAIGEMAWQDLSISGRIKDLEFRPLELSGPNILLGPAEKGGKAASRPVLWLRRAGWGRLGACRSTPFVRQTVSD